MNVILWSLRNIIKTKHCIHVTIEVTFYGHKQFHTHYSIRVCNLNDVTLRVSQKMLHTHRRNIPLHVSMNIDEIEFSLLPHRTINSNWRSRSVKRLVSFFRCQKIGYFPLDNQRKSIFPKNTLRILKRRENFPTVNNIYDYNYIIMKRFLFAGTHTVTVHNERSVRPMERSDQLGKVGRHRLFGIRRRTSDGTYAYYIKNDKVHENRTQYTNTIIWRACRKRRDFF